MQWFVLIPINQTHQTKINKHKNWNNKNNEFHLEQHLTSNSIQPTKNHKLVEEADSLQNYLLPGKRWGGGETKHWYVSGISKDECLIYSIKLKAKFILTK